MNRKEAIESAKKRLDTSGHLTGLLAKFGTVRVFPVDCDDFVTFSVSQAPALFAEYQNIKGLAFPPPPPATP